MSDKRIIEQVLAELLSPQQKPDDEKSSGFLLYLLTS